MLAEIQAGSAGTKAARNWVRHARRPLLDTALGARASAIGWKVDCQDLASGRRRALGPV